MKQIIEQCKQCLGCNQLEHSRFTGNINCPYIDKYEQVNIIKERE